MTIKTTVWDRNSEEAYLEAGYDESDSTFTFYLDGKEVFTIREEDYEDLSKLLVAMTS